MRTIKFLAISGVLFLASFGSDLQAQEKGYYYFAWAYSYDTKVMYVTDVKYVDCEVLSLNDATENAIQLQWRDYVKAEYRNSFKYTYHTFANKSRKKTETRRREVMGGWNHTIFRIHNFNYFCD